MASWFFIHYRKSVTFNTFQFRDDSELKSGINKTFCGHRLHWFKKIKSDLLFSNAVWNYNREWEKSKYLDNISVLPTSIFIFNKFVDGTQPEVAGEIVGRRHILRTLVAWWKCLCLMNELVNSSLHLWVTGNYLFAPAQKCWLMDILINYW